MHQSGAAKTTSCTNMVCGRQFGRQRADSRLAFLLPVMYQAFMSDDSIQQLASKLVASLPDGLKSMREELESNFLQYGSVLSARIIGNRANGKSKGYGFVEMNDRPQAESAIKALNGRDFSGRRIVVNEAKSRARSR